MYGITLNMYGLDGAYILAATAAYAQFRSGLGNGQTAFKRNHVDCLYGTVLGACSATGAVHVHYADILVEYHAARLCAVFLLNRKRFDCSGRKNFIGPDMRLEMVTLKKTDAVDDLLSFYMGKNTMERQNFIIDNLVVEEDIVDEDEGEKF